MRDKRVHKIGNWRYELALSNTEGQIRTVLLCWKGDRKKQFRVIQYRSGCISCQECVAARCLHIRKAVKAGLFDRATWLVCLQRRGIVPAPPKEKAKRQPKRLIDFS